MQILPSRSISRLTLMVCPHSFQEVSTETYAHWISPTEKTWWNRCLGAGFPFPVTVGLFPMVTASGEFATEKCPASKRFQATWDFSTQNGGKAIFILAKKIINREYVFRSLSIRNCVVSKTWDIQACPEDWNTRLRAMCLPALCELYKHSPRPYHDCPWGSRLWECVWERWVPYCGHLVKVSVHFK